MKTLNEYSALSDQDLVSMIQSHSLENISSTDSLEIQLLKVEYERRLMHLKSFSLMDLMISSVIIGCLLPFLIASMFNISWDPPLALFLPSRNYILCTLGTSILLFYSLKYLLDYPSRERKKKRLAQPNNFYIDKPDPAHRLTPRDIQILGDRSGELSSADNLLIKVLLNKLREEKVKLESSQSVKVKTWLLSRNFSDSEFGRVSDFELKARLAKVDKRRDPGMYGKLIFEFERRDPRASRSTILWWMFLLLLLTSWAFIQGLDSIFGFMGGLGPDHQLLLALALALGIAGLLKIYHNAKISFQSKMREPNPVGFFLDHRDPAYRFERQDFDAVDKALERRIDLTKEDLNSLHEHRRKQGTLNAVIFFILAVGAVWIYKMFA